MPGTLKKKYGLTVNGNNELEWSNLDGINLSSTDLNELKSDYHNNICYGNQDNRCLNLPPEVDAFKLIIFSVNGDTYQLIIGLYRNCMYLRHTSDGEWEDWNRLNPPISEDYAKT